MKYTVNKMTSGENELILNYSTECPEVEAALSFMEKNQHKLVGRTDEETILISPSDILYVEKVDDKTYAYTDNKVVQIDISLHSLEILLDDISYFRCSKSMIVNVRKVVKLKSMSSNRIDAVLESGEHIIISRTYASDFRKLLRGEL